MPHRGRKPLLSLRCQLKFPLHSGIGLITELASFFGLVNNLQRPSSGVWRSVALWRPLLPDQYKPLERLLSVGIVMDTNLGPTQLFLALFSWDIFLLQSEGIKPDDFTWEAFLKFLDNLCLRPEIQSIFEERYRLSLFLRLSLIHFRVLTGTFLSAAAAPRGSHSSPWTSSWNSSTAGSEIPG